MRIFPYVAALFAFAAGQSASAEQAPAPQFFESIVSQATPVADFVGKRETSADAAGKVRFDYDDQHRPVRLRYLVDDALRNFGLIGAAEVRIEYDNDMEIRTYWDADGNPDQVWRICYRGLNFATEGAVHKESFTLDDKGRRIALALFDSQGRATSTHFGAASYRWNWIDDDTVIEVRSGAEGASDIPLTHFFDFTRTRISFDTRGIHWLLENIDRNNDLTLGAETNVAAVRFEYNAALNEADYSFYDASDRIAERRAYGPMPHGYARITNSFTNDGRLLEEIYRDRFNQPVNNSAGFARAIYDYDENGAFVGTRFVSVAGDNVEYSRPY